MSFPRWSAVRPLLDFTLGAEGMSWIRSAIHAAGASTPGWDNDAHSAAELVEYRLGEATTTPLIAV